MFEQTFKNIDDVLWKEASCSSELDYTEQSSWILKSLVFKTLFVLVFLVVPGKPRLNLFKTRIDLIK